MLYWQYQASLFEYTWQNCRTHTISSILALGPQIGSLHRKSCSNLFLRSFEELSCLGPWTWLPQGRYAKSLRTITSQHMTIPPVGTHTTRRREGGRGREKSRPYLCSEGKCLSDTCCNQINLSPQAGYTLAFISPQMASLTTSGSLSHVFIMRMAESDGESSTAAPNTLKL